MKDKGRKTEGLEGKEGKKCKGKNEEGEGIQDEKKQQNKSMIS